MCGRAPRLDSAPNSRGRATSPIKPASDYKPTRSTDYLAGYLVARPFAGAADPGLDDVRFYVNFALRRAGRPNSRQRTSASPRGELTRSASFDPGRPTAITGGARGYESCGSFHLEPRSAGGGGLLLLAHDTGGRSVGGTRPLELGHGLGDPAGRAVIEPVRVEHVVVGPAGGRRARLQTGDPSLGAREPPDASARASPRPREAGGGPDGVAPSPRRRALACTVARTDYKGNRPTISDYKAIRAELTEIRQNPVSDYTDPDGLQNPQTRRPHMAPHARGACRPRERRDHSPVCVRFLCARELATFRHAL